MSSPSYPYAAFLSYSHADRLFAAWLHRKLESYRVPRTFVGKSSNGFGTTPPHLKPVFRDREELASSPNLSHAITTALNDSAFLIVLCSPAAARSRWVNEEILAYKRIGRADRILPIIVAGTPHAADPAQECFPQALKYHLGEDAELSPDLPAESVAADARSTGDGRNDAFLKLAAGMLGVGFDALKRRELARRQRRLFVGLVGALTLAAVVGGLAVVATLRGREAVRQREAALANLRQAQGAVDSFYSHMSESSLQHVPELRGLREELSVEAAAYYEKFAAHNAQDPTLKRELAETYWHLAELDRSLGKPEDTFRAYEREQQVLTALIKDDPGDEHHRWVLATLVGKMGNHCAQYGTQEQVRRYQAEDLALWTALLHDHPDNHSYQRGFARCKEELGELYGQTGQPDAARAQFEEALAVFGKSTESKQKKHEFEHDLGYCCYHYGNFLAANGHPEEALAKYELALNSLAAAAGRSPQSLDIQLHLARCLDQKALTLAALGRPDDAKDLAEQAIQISTNLVHTDDHDVEFRYELALTHDHAAEQAQRRGDADAVRDHLGAAARALAFSSQTVSLARADYLKDSTQLAAKVRLVAVQQGIALADAPADGPDPAAQKTGDEVLNVDDIKATSVYSAMGRVVRVQGKVAKVATLGSSKVTLISFEGAENGTAKFTAVIYAEAGEEVSQAFGGNLRGALTGKRIELRGVLATYKYAPQIVITRPDQIRLLEPGSGDAAPPATPARTPDAPTPAKAPPEKPVASSASSDLGAGDTAAIAARQGQAASVSGVLSGVVSKTSITLLDFEGNSYSGFVGTIRPANLAAVSAAFGADLNKALKGKSVRISGEVSLFRGIPQIEIKSADQIRVAP